jgi:hypothetical protein
MNVEYQVRLKRVKALAKPYSDNKIQMLRRVYCDQRSFELPEKHRVEFEIKEKVADYYGIDFNSVLICGSAHLGFSPVKETIFEIGYSDIDIAIVDCNLFQLIWSRIIEDTHSFTYQHLFPPGPKRCSGAEFMQTMIAKRGLIHGHILPYTASFDTHRELTAELTKSYSKYFSKVSFGFYMNEIAFHLKQLSAIKGIFQHVE